MWVLFAFLTSVCNAVYYIFNQNSKLEPSHFMVYRGYFLAVAATPVALISGNTFDWPFYVIALLQGVVISYSDFKYFQAFGKFGAENVTAVNPLTVIITFFMWLLYQPKMVVFYMATPVKSCFIILSIGLMVLSVIKYRAQPIGLDCFKFLLPILVLVSLIDISNKIVMQYAGEHLFVATINRVAITGWVIGTINLVAGKRHNLRTEDLINVNNLKKGSFILLLALSMITLNYSMYYALNPAYTTSIIYLSVVWIMVINYIAQVQGRKYSYQKMSHKWIFVLLMATSVLSVLAF